MKPKGSSQSSITKTPEVSLKLDNANETIKIEERIYQELEKQKLCYVLSSPKSTKIDLLKRIKNLLMDDNSFKFTVVKHDNKILSKEEWYENFINKISNDFAINCSSETWKQNNKHIKKNPNLSLKEYIDKKVINSTNNTNLVIIIDDLEKIFESLPFRLEFFNFIDFCYTQRATNENYKRLNFLLYGSADPYIDSDAEIDAGVDSDRVEQVHISVAWIVNLENILTPEVNIIKSHQPEDFWGTLDVDKILLHLWESTQGHPLLTQEIFKQLVRNSSLISTDEEIEFVEQQVKYLVDNTKNS